MGLLKRDWICNIGIKLYMYKTSNILKCLCGCVYTGTMLTNQALTFKKMGS